MPAKVDILPLETIDNLIYLLRGQKVMLDFDLAALYGVETRVLNQAVKRNSERFPSDFMFRLSVEEMECLRDARGSNNSSQIVMSSAQNSENGPKAAGLA
ncbi:MAG TPA: ORF6N domain-containing protein [Verrucomicrobiae bacterium]|nr:ORF6N domain-containing protein [Verrucomicrobiae bacterium]